MKIDLIVVTNGRRDCIGRSLPDIYKAFPAGFEFHRKIISDDSPAADQFEFEQWICDDVLGWNREAGWEIVHTAGETGFDGAYRQVWVLGAQSDADYVFVVEDDFLFNRMVPLSDMVAVLEANPNLAQIALLRQPWNDHERSAGGIIQMHPDWYTEAHMRHDGHQVRWLEHVVCFTTNPFLAPTALMRQGPMWPKGPDSEGRYGFDVRREGFSFVHGEDVRFAYFGTREMSPWVTHIGHVRTGSGY